MAVGKALKPGRWGRHLDFVSKAGAVLVLAAATIASDWGLSTSLKPTGGPSIGLGSKREKLNDSAADPYWEPTVVSIHEAMFSATDDLLASFPRAVRRIVVDTRRRIGSGD